MARSGPVEVLHNVEARVGASDASTRGSHVGGDLVGLVLLQFTMKFLLARTSCVGTYPRRVFSL